MLGTGETASRASLAERIDVWPRPLVWAVIACAALTLAGLDRAFRDVGMGPLYIPLIAAAGWRLGLRASCLVAITAALLNIFPLHVQDEGLTPPVLAARAALRLFTYGFIVTIVHGFRRAYDRQRFMARRDLMTGVVNRATFEHHVEALLAARKTPHQAVLLATMDIDDFKSINDTHGHAAGDAALRAFAAAAQTLLRPADCLGRIGGDEFALAMPLCSIEEGADEGERFHRQLSILLRTIDYPVTVSMGILIVPAACRIGRLELMREVDRALYQVKARGKGGVQARTILPFDTLCSDGQAGATRAAA